MKQITMAIVCLFFIPALLIAQKPKPFFKSKTQYKISAKPKKGGAKPPFDCNVLEALADGRIITISCGGLPGPCEDTELSLTKSPRQPRPCICRVVTITYVGGNTFTVKSPAENVAGSFKAARLSKSFLNAINLIQDKTLSLTAQH